MTGIKPVFADKEVMTDPIQESTFSKKVSPPPPPIKLSLVALHEFKVCLCMQQTNSKLKPTSTQTIMTGPRAEHQISGSSKCLSHLSSRELEEYLRDSPPPSDTQSDDGDEPCDVLSDVLPALSSKNRWMFELSDSARSSAFKLQVRFMRALIQNANDQEDSTPSSVVSSSLLSRELCSTFTKIQCINNQLQVLPAVNVLKEKVGTVTSSVRHLLSHLPIPKGRLEFDDLAPSMRLSLGGAAYNIGWKMKELLGLLTKIKTDRLPWYFRAEIKRVTACVENALQFGLLDMVNVTIDHSPRQARISTRIKRLLECGDIDLDDILSSASDDDDDEPHQRTEEELEVDSDQGVSLESRKRRRTFDQTDNQHNHKGHKRHRKRKEKMMVSEKRSEQKQFASPLAVFSQQPRKSKKTDKSKMPKSSNSIRSSSVHSAGMSPISSTVSNSTRTYSKHSSSPMHPRSALIANKPTALVIPSSSGGSAVTVTPILSPTLSEGNLSEPIKLLTSLAASMWSKETPAKAVAATCTSFNSQPEVTQITDVAVSSVASTSEQMGSISKNISSPLPMSGRLEISGLSSDEFTPIVKAISPPSTTSSQQNLMTTPLSKNCPLSSAPSVAHQASSVECNVLPKSPFPSTPSSVAQQASLVKCTAFTKPPPPHSTCTASQKLAQPLVSATSSMLSLASSTLPPPIVATAPLLGTPPWGNVMPPMSPPSIVTASTLPSQQKSARQVSVCNVTKAPAPLMRASTMNSFPTTFSGLSVPCTSRLGMPAASQLLSGNPASHCALHMVATNGTPVLGMPLSFTLTAPTVGTLLNSLTTPPVPISPSSYVASTPSSGSLSICAPRYSLASSTTIGHPPSNSIGPTVSHHHLSKTSTPSLSYSSLELAPRMVSLTSDKEQSVSEEKQALTTGPQHRRRKQARLQHQESISPTVAAIKAAIYKKRKSTSQNSATSSTTTSSYTLDAITVSPQGSALSNDLTTSAMLTASPTVSDVYSNSLMCSAAAAMTEVSATVVSSSSVPVSVVAMDDKERTRAPPTSSSEVATSSVSTAPQTEIAATSTVPVTVVAMDDKQRTRAPPTSSSEIAINAAPRTEIAATSTVPVTVLATDDEQQSRAPPTSSSEVATSSVSTAPRTEIAATSTSYPTSPLETCTTYVASPTPSPSSPVTPPSSVTSSETNKDSETMSVLQEVVSTGLPSPQDPTVHNNRR